MSAKSAQDLNKMLEGIRDLVSTFDEQYFEELMQDMFKESLYAAPSQCSDVESLGPRAELYFALIGLHKQMCQFSKSSRQ